MDKQRIILFGILVIIGSILWNDWNIEHVKNKQQNNTVNSAVVTQQMSPRAQQKAAQTVSSGSAGQAAVVTAAIPTVSEDNLIHVHTDVLNVAIDKKTGAIVRAYLSKYPISLQQKDDPVKILSHDSSHYKVALNGLVDKSGHELPISYSSSAMQYTLAPGQQQLNVVLTGKTASGVQLTQTYQFGRGQYDIKLKQTINNTSAKVWQGAFFNELVANNSAPSHHSLRYHSFTGASYSTATKPYNKASFKSLWEKNINQTSRGGWFAFQQPYFVVAWAPNQAVQNHFYSFTQNMENQPRTYTIGASQPLMTLNPGQQKITTDRLYVGPEIQSNLKKVASHLELTVDYGWLWMFSDAIFWVMQKIYNVIGNWGWSIVLVTLIIKLLFFKLSQSSYQSMARMRELAPRLKSLKEQHGDDRQKLSQATMQLYREKKVNPIGGCLPMIIQVPVFIALYYVLIESVQLRQAPFIFWIHDLSVKDPYYILPILMGISMFVQQRLSPAPADPTQAKVMMFMPVMFTVFFLNFPVGLVLYWLVNNCLSVLQQWIVMRTYDSNKDNHNKKKRKKKGLLSQFR